MHRCQPGFVVLAASCVLATTGLASAGTTERHIRPGRALRGASGVVLTDRGGRILAVNADGSGVMELTGPGEAGNPVASPDGSAIAFNEPTAYGADSHVYVMNADGTGRVRLASGEGPQWSPDGQWLAYQAKSGIYIVRPDGTAKHRVANATGLVSWSPDSASLAYASAAGIAAVDLGTGAQRLLVHAARAANPSWSPDGRRIAYVRDHGDATSNVYVAELDGSQPRLLGPGSDETLSWSPDGTRIAYGTGFFCVALRGEAQAKVVVVDVSTARTILAIPGIAGAAAGHASWSPDGSKLAFERANAAGSCLERGADVWVVNADGTGLSRVTEAFPFAGVQSPPTWWPGRLQVAPDPPIQTLALHTIARRSVRRGSNSIVGADRTRVAIENDIQNAGSALGVWRGHGRVAWIRNAGGDSAAFSGRRVYWTEWTFIPGYFDTYLWTAARPGRRPRLLRSREESIEAPGGQPIFKVRDDGSLTVYTLHGSLWRLRGVHSRRIRHERTQFSLLAVGGGRVLLQRSDRRVELVSSRGKLLRTFAGQTRYVGGALSGRRLVLATSKQISVFDSRTGRLRARWPVGAPGVSPSVGFMYKALLPYSDGSALHVLDVDTGHDVIVRIVGVTAPVGGAITKAGLIYTWTQTYSLSPGRMAVVPLPDLMAAVRAAR